MTKSSKDHHSAQIMTVAGIDTAKYSPQPLNDSLFGQKSAGCILSTEWAKIVTEMNSMMQVRAMANPQPRMPYSILMMKSQHQTMWKAVQMN